MCRVRMMVQCERKRRHAERTDAYSPMASSSSLMLPISLISSSSSSSSLSAAASAASFVANRWTYSVRVFRLTDGRNHDDPLTLHLPLVLRRMPHQKCSSLAIQWVIRVWVTEKLRKKDFKDVDHIYESERQSSTHEPTIDHATCTYQT